MPRSKAWKRSVSRAEMQRKVKEARRGLSELIEPDGEVNIDESADTTECWRCGKQRYTYESCPHCGGSCKPKTRRKQKESQK